MINLLPMKYKKAAQKEFLRRFIAVFGLGLLVLVITELLFSLGLLFSASSSFESFERQTTFSEEMANLKKLDELEMKMRDLNHLLDLCQKEEENLQIISDDISYVLDILPPSIKINSLLFQNEQLSLFGHADIRGDLLSFVDKLETVSSFEKVESPISNLLVENDIEFSLVIKLSR